MAARQQQQKVQYEDFVPTSKCLVQPEAILLLIPLPGFTKEQIRVTCVHATRTLRIAGERPLAAAVKRWSRFTKEFPVQESCRVDKLHGNFVDGILTITMPKHTVSDVPEVSRMEKEKKLPEEGPVPPEKVEKPKEEQKAPESEEKKPLEHPKGKELGRREERKLPEESKQEEKKLPEESKGKERLSEAGEEDRQGEHEEKKLVEEPIEKETARKLKEKLAPEDSYKKPVVSTGDEVGREEGGYLGEKKKKERGLMEKIGLKEMVISEDKRLMVNIGVAALAVFAIGALVYRFSSSSPSSSSSSSSSSENKK